MQGRLLQTPEQKVENSFLKESIFPFADYNDYYVNTVFSKFSQVSILKAEEKEFCLALQ